MPSRTPHIGDADEALRTRLDDLTPPGDPGERPPESRPRAFIIGGQPGAGKTLSQLHVQSASPPYTAVYDGDDNATYHSNFREIVKRDPQHGHATASSDLPDDFHDNCLDHLRAGDKKYDVIASHPLGRAEWADTWVNGFKENDYHVSVAFIATHSANSYLGILHRYQHQRNNLGYGRWMPPEIHDKFYEDIPGVVDHLERSEHVDSIYILDRDGRVLHENHWAEDGNRTNPIVGRETLVDERNRPPTQDEIRDFDKKVTYLRENDLRVNGAPEELPALVDEAERRHREHLTASTGSSVDARDREQRQSLSQALNRSRETEHLVPPTESPDSAPAEAPPSPAPSVDQAETYARQSLDVAEKLRMAKRSLDDHHGSSPSRAGSASRSGTSAPAPPTSAQGDRQPD